MANPLLDLEFTELIDGLSNKGLCAIAVAILILSQWGESPRPTTEELFSLVALRIRENLGDHPTDEEYRAYAAKTLREARG